MPTCGTWQVLVVTVSPAEEQITEYFGVTASDMPAVTRDAALCNMLVPQGSSWFGPWEPSPPPDM